MGPLEAYSAIVTELGAAPHAARVSEARAAFQARTGAFGPEDAWFEARSRAFWDDATTTGGLAPLAEGAAADARAWIPAFARAHRGLFLVNERPRDDDATVLSCLLTGAAFFVDDVEPGTRDALEAATAPFDGRVVAAGPPTSSPLRVALLPGAVFHPADAARPIAKVLEVARTKGLSREQTLDALLRMELSLRALSRVKASYAYRTEALRA
jgi:hypothetical protein